jgi:integrase
MRPKRTATDLPPRMLRRKKRLKSGKLWISYYYNGRDKNGKRKEIPLGSDLQEALYRWSKLHCSSIPTSMSGTMAELFDRYEREILPKKKPRTIRSYKSHLKQLRLAFGDAPINAITPDDVQTYLDCRSARVQANREVSLLSHVFTMAKIWKYTDRDSPTRSVNKNNETPRSFYADDEVWSAVYAVASDELRQAMDLAYLSAQRITDVIAFRISDVRPDRRHGLLLHLQQNKGDKPLRIRLYRPGKKITTLGKLIQHLLVVAATKKSSYLVSNPRGMPFSETSLRRLFNCARKKAHDDALAQNDTALADRIAQFWFRDIRPKAATEIGNVDKATALLNHSSPALTRRVYMRLGPLVDPTK